MMQMTAPQTASGESSLGLLLRKGHMSWDCQRSAGALPQRPTVTLAQHRQHGP